MQGGSERFDRGQTDVIERPRDRMMNRIGVDRRRVESKLRVIDAAPRGFDQRLHRARIFQFAEGVRQAVEIFASGNAARRSRIVPRASIAALRIGSSRSVR
jgi:hypothetical protein